MPFSYGTCLAVARLVGFDGAEEVLFQAVRTSTDPMEVARARMCHDMATYELRDDDYLGSLIGDRMLLHRGFPHRR